MTLPSPLSSHKNEALSRLLGASKRGEAPLLTFPREGTAGVADGGSDSFFGFLYRCIWQADDGNRSEAITHIPFQVAISMTLF